MTRRTSASGVQSTRALVAEQIAVAASNLARTARANGLPQLTGLIEAVVLEAWREASEPDSEARKPHPAQSAK